VSGIYDAKDETTVTRQMYFHWDYLNEELKKRLARRAEYAGVFVVQIADPSRAAEISARIDSEFKNSLAETLTETEKAFSLGFVAQTEAIVTAVKIVSFVVIVIIFAVVANVMAMTTRERLAEYATMKAIGFGPGFVVMLIVAESMMLTALGAGAGIALTFPIAAGFKASMGSMFPVFYVRPDTVLMQAACGAVVGLLAGLLPSIRASRVRIVDGLRHVG
jgi:putative ABC transport system permease protein